MRLVHTGTLLTSLLAPATQVARGVPQFGSYAGILLGISAISLIWFGAFYFISEEWHHTETAALQNGANLARAFEEQIIRAIHAVDQTLIYVRDSYSKDPDHFDISLWSRNSQFLSDFAFQVGVIEKSGMLIASNIDRGARLDLSDREHFTVHAHRNTDELFISRPVFGRVSNKWSIQLTRRINAPDGSFGGVVVVSLDPDYLARFYNAIDIGEHGAVTLVGTDGIIRARSPAGDSIGRSIRGGKFFERATAAPAGALYTEGEVDGTVRMLSYRTVKGYPLIVAVGLGRDDIFSLFEHDRRNYLVAAGLLSAWLLAVTILILQYQRGVTKARDAAQAGSRSRSEFLAVMSHEIRTPMNGVLGMADLLIDSGLQEEQTKLAHTLRDSAEYLLQLINDVLDFSKLDADRVELEKLSFDVRALLHGAVDVLKPSADARSIYCDTAVAATVPPLVTGDPARLRQVLLNLIGNAVKFTETGGVTVTVDASPSPRPGLLVLSFRIADTGIGIPPDAIGLLFREFSQIDSSISRRFGGTGLGLAICKRLVGLMGGDIGVTSVPGHGSVFTFTIEVAAATQTTADALEDAPSIVAPQPTAAHGLRILVAEDNPTNQMVIGKLLAAAGHAADIAGNGVEAVARCTAQAYDLIFMDVMMPEMDGLAATRAIRDRPGPNRTVRIVALTANAFPEDRQQCRAAGMDGFLTKPVTRRTLSAFFESLPPTRPVTAAGAAGPVPEEEAVLFDIAIYRELEQALGGEDASMVLTTFLTDAEQRLGVLDHAAGERDNETIAQEAHALKSSAASVGFMRLSQLARRLEAAAKSADDPVSPSTIAPLYEAYTTAARAAHDHCMPKELV